MNSKWLELIPENLHDAARTALRTAFGSTLVDFVEPVLGGASGALTHRIEANGRFYILRIETRRSPFRNPHQYTCMQIAADGGIAPPLRYADERAGVAIIDYVIQQPLDAYPGGPLALAAAVGKLAAQLQATTAFPVLGDYRVFLDRMLGYVRTRFVPGLLDPHLEAFERIRGAYPWDEAAHVSSHNDPNPRNILFDGDRLWLVDWETAYRNDPLTDIAILTENHAAAPDLQEALLESWLGHPSDRVLEARLLLMRLITRLYYAALLSTISMKSPELTNDLAAPSPEEFKARVFRGELKPGSTEAVSLLGKMMLAGFLARVNTLEFEDALKTVRLG